MMQTISKKRCRTCLIISETNMHCLDETYDLINEKDSRVTLWKLLEACSSIQRPSDGVFPNFLCKTCLQKAVDSYRFRLQCEKAHTQLQLELKSNQDILEMEIKHLKPNSQNPNTKPTKKDSTTPTPEIQNDAGKKKLISHTPITRQYKDKHKHAKTGRSSRCQYCSESLGNATQLARHMEQMHSDLKTIKCLECTKRFFKEANLRLHMNVHSGIKRHMCEVCGVSFALAGNLITHRRLHTGHKPYTCNQCGRGFTQQAALRSHEAGHSNKKDHVCQECGAAFSRVGALRNHTKRHQPIRPFACSLCNKAFTFSSERKRHMAIHTGEKNYECNVCGNRFNRSTNLAVHRRIHTGETPHVCSVCGKGFSQAHSLRLHMATHPSS